MTDGPVGAAPDGDSGPPPHQRSHVRGSTLLVAGRVIALLLGMATQVVIVRALTKADFGAFAYALALAGGAEVLLSLGQGKLLSRFLATYEEQRDYPRMFGAIVLAVGTIVVTSVVGVIGLYVFRDALVGSVVGDGDEVSLVLILVFLSPLQALDQVFVSLFAVFSKPRAIFVRKHLLAPGLRLVVVSVLVLVGADVTWLAIGYVLAGLVGFGFYLVLLIGALRERGLLAEFSLRRIIVPFGAVFSFSLPLISGELMLLSTTVGGVMVLGLFHPATEVADYRAVFSSARLNTAVATSFATLFLPAISRLYARRDLANLRHTYWQTAGFVAVFTFPVFALTVPLAPATTVALFGERYAGSAAVLSVLAAGYYINAMLGFNAYTLQVCGRLRYLVVVNVLAAGLNIGLCFLLAPGYGAVGVAVANTTALVAQNLLNQAKMSLSIGGGFIARDFRSCYASVLAGAAVLWAVQLVASPGLVGSLVAAALVSAAVLAGSRRSLALAETFPEVRRVPLVRWLLA